MKLPFSVLLTPVIKPYFGESRQFCQNPIFALSIFYTYFYGALGFIININHLRTHIGEVPRYYSNPNDSSLSDESMLIHDLKIIATSMGIVQYACLVVGCFTKNPALFLPHLTGQLVLVLVKIVNVFLLTGQLNMKTIKKLGHKIAAILLMTFNWCQEFCVFRQFLCICDL